jgi:3-hydroxyisobutyrate dehydrogenase-like beta-hydroxyacid dehydrogenase
MVEGVISPLPGLSIGLREKDSRYCLGLADDSDQGMDLGRVAHAWYALAAATMDAADDSALIETVAAQAGRLPGN